MGVVRYKDRIWNYRPGPIHRPIPTGSSHLWLEAEGQDPVTIAQLGAATHGLQDSREGVGYSRISSPWENDGRSARVRGWAQGHSQARNQQALIQVVTLEVRIRGGNSDQVEPE